MNAVFRVIHSPPLPLPPQLLLPSRTTGPKAIVDRALQKVKAGDIILMHDIHPDSIRAIPDLVAGLQKKGMELVTVSELIRSRVNATAAAP